MEHLIKMDVFFFSNFTKMTYLDRQRKENEETVEYLRR